MVKILYHKLQKMYIAVSIISLLIYERFYTQLFLLFSMEFTIYIVFS